MRGPIVAYVAKQSPYPCSGSRNSTSILNSSDTQNAQALPDPLQHAQADAFPGSFHVTLIAALRQADVHELSTKSSSEFGQNRFVSPFEFVD